MNIFSSQNWVYLVLVSIIAISLVSLIGLTMAYIFHQKQRNRQSLNQISKLRTALKNANLRIVSLQTENKKLLSQLNALTINQSPADIEFTSTKSDKQGGVNTLYNAIDINASFDSPSNENLQEVVSFAIANKKPLKIVYKSYKGEITSRIIQPLEWIDQDKFAAYCQLRQEDREFRLSRIQDYKL